MEAPVLLTLQISSLDCSEEALRPDSVIPSSRCGLLCTGTCVYASVVLQVASGGELLATVLLLAYEGLLAVVSPHVNLQPLQHVEALPAPLRAAPEHSVIPGRRSKHAPVSPVWVLLTAAKHKVRQGKA